MMQGKAWLQFGGVLSLLAAALHVACIALGPDVYAFFGAPPDIVNAVKAGKLWPHLVTLGIAVVLTIWALYAFSGAAMMRRLPLLRTGLEVISAIYLARGLLIIPVVLTLPYAKAPFDYWSSAIVLVYGIAYTIGTWQAWPNLKPQRSEP